MATASVAGQRWAAVLILLVLGIFSLPVTAYLFDDEGSENWIVPIADCALLSAKLLKNGTLKVYKGLPHGMCTTHAEVINPDLLAFVAGKSITQSAAA